MAEDKLKLVFDKKYVAFCDVLGFSNAVEDNFELTIEVYHEFKKTILNWPLAAEAKTNIYSDSIIVVADSLVPVVQTVQALNWAALLHNWLIRGGIAHGKHWYEKDGENVFVVSEALVKAVRIEKSIKIPAVVISNDIELGIEAWVPRFQYNAHEVSILQVGGHAIVNPFNRFWYASAIMRVKCLLDEYPEYSNKYQWFLSLAESINKDDLLVPQSAIEKMVNLGILKDLACNE